MQKSKIVVCNSNPIHRNVEEHAKVHWNAFIIREKTDLTFEKLSEVDPEYVFFLHWSHLIPKEVHERFKCILFHMTDLPFGRGGSPLQNLIVRGHSETMISALQVSEGIDTGQIYLKRRLSLEGTAEEIFLRAGATMFEMIKEFIEKNPEGVEQQGEVTLFKRRTPAQGSLQQLREIKEIYDFIRMLDADGYPKAFIETEFFIFEFSRASLKKDGIVADVRITKKS